MTHRTAANLARKPRATRAERRQGELDHCLAELMLLGERLPLRDRDLGAFAAAVARLNCLVAAECHSRLAGTEAPERFVHRERNV